MRISITKDSLKKVLAIAFWIVVWQVISVIVGSEIVLVSPVKVLSTLGALCVQGGFWKVVLHSFLRIMAGFFLAMIVGIGFAALSARFSVAGYLLSPVMSVIKATPVASFIILALFWFGSTKLSIFTAFLMVVPVIYANLLEGITQTDKGLIEMARLFRMKRLKKLMYIYLPAVSPYFLSACRVSLGLCWKAGIAAEVIGQPNGSIGEQLYYSKLYFDTAELFAWTVVIIAVSVAFEKLFTYGAGVLLNRVGKNANSSKEIKPKKV